MCGSPRTRNGIDSFYMVKKDANIVNYLAARTTSVHVVDWIEFSF